MSRLNRRNAVTESQSEHPEYVLVTIDDIYRMVPPDRTGACLEEMRDCMERSRDAERGFDAIAKELDPGCGALFKWDSFTWIDDGKTDSECRIRFPDAEAVIEVSSEVPIEERSVPLKVLERISSMLLMGSNLASRFDLRDERRKFDRLLGDLEAYLYDPVAGEQAMQEYIRGEYHVLNPDADQSQRSPMDKLERARTFLTGKSWEECVRWARDNMLLLRITERYGQKCIGTCDVNMDRINVAVENGVVIKVNGIG